MGYANIQADSNFYRQSLNADGIKYVTGPYTSLYEDVFRAVTVTTDSVVSVTSYVGDSLSSEFLLAGTEIYGLFSSVTIHSGNAVLHLAGASYISEIINQYSATGIPLGFYEEGTQCLSQKISALLTQGVFDKASWIMVPSQIEEDWVRAFRPTSELGNLSFTRASDGTRTNAQGVVERTPWNLASYSEQFDNAFWTKFSNGTGVAPIVTPNDAIAPNGTLTADKIVLNTGAGTTTANQSNINWSTPTLTGQTITWSVYLRGSVGGEKVLLGQHDGGYAPLITLTTSWQRYTYTAVVGSGSRQFSFGIRQGIYGTINSTATIYAWGAQVVEGTEAKPYFMTTNRQDVPRLDYRNADGTLSSCPRLLLEPQRTNSIRNSSMVGAVAGSPGTLPTNWTQFFGTGLTRTVVGTGTENGLPYVDVRLSGTSSDTRVEILTESSSGISASNGQTWSTSAYVKIVSAPIPPNSYVLKSYYWNGGAYVNESNTSFTPTTTLARYSAAHTIPSGTITHISQAVRMNITNGAAYDFTIRIAAPQMELGAYATTWVPTTTAAVTRLADDAIKTGISSLIGQTEGTIFADIRYEVAQQARIAITDNTTNNWIFFSFPESGTNSRIYIRSSNVVNVDQSLLSLFTANQTYKIALAYKTGNWAFYVNGTQLASGTNSINFNGTFDRIIATAGGAVGAGQPIYTKYNQAALFTTRLSNSELQSLTTL